MQLLSQTEQTSIDLHCHCLAGLDDGPATLDEALALCRALVADGVSEVVATPHQLGRYDGRNGGEGIRQATRRLREALAKAEVPLTIHPGGDVRLDERIPRLLEEGEVLTLADRGSYLLLELPRSVQIDPRPLIKQLRRQGVTAVLTHPERYDYLQFQPQRVLPWLEAGAHLQLTAASVIGEFGREAEKAAWHWLEKGLVSVIASDAHGAQQRPPRMRQAMAAIFSRLGAQAARQLGVENPRRVIGGELLPRVFGK